MDYEKVDYYSDILELEDCEVEVDDFAIKKFLKYKPKKIKRGYNGEEIN